MRGGPAASGVRVVDEIVVDQCGRMEDLERRGHRDHVVGRAPADAERLTAEEPSGVRHVLVNGTPIRSDDRSRLDSLEHRPGMWPDIA